MSSSIETTPNPSTLRPYMWLGLLGSFLAAFYFQSTGIAEDNSYLRSAPYFVLFFALADTPHFFLTFLRTHADKTEWVRHKIYHTLGFAGIFLTTAYFYFHSSENFLEFVQYLGSFHIYRQNVGFHRSSLRQDGADADEFKREQRYYLTIMAMAWIVPHFSPWSVGTAMAINLAFVAAMHFVFKIRPNERNIYFTLTQVITYWAFQSTFNPAVGTIVETLYHDIQYIVFMLAFQTYRRLPVKNFFILLGTGAVLGFLAEGPVIEPIARRWVYATVLGVLVYHYVIDGLIWRFSKSPELSPLRSLAVFKTADALPEENQISKVS